MHDDSEIQGQAPKHFIKEWMKVKGVTQEDVSEWMDRSQGMVSRVLNNHSRLTYTFMTKIARGLGVRVADLLCDPTKPRYDHLLDGLTETQLLKVARIVDLFRDDDPGLTDPGASTDKTRTG